MRGIKITNDYARAMGDDVYRDCPKAVLAAIVVSSLTCGGDRLDKARAEVLREWEVLHANGIISQAPPATFRDEIAAARVAE